MKPSKTCPLAALVLAVALAVAGCGKDAAPVRYSQPPTPQAGKAPGMKVQRLSEDGGERRYAVVFSAGDDVLSGLTDFARQEKLGASQLTAIGGVQEATLGWYDRGRKMFREIPVDQQAEVTSLVGDIALSGDQPAVHIHANVALEDGSVRGGHVLRAQPTDAGAVDFPADESRNVDELLADGARRLCAGERGFDRFFSMHTKENGYPMDACRGTRAIVLSRGARRLRLGEPRVESLARVKYMLDQFEWGRTGVWPLDASAR